jgi:hypothetical protein
MAVTQQGAQRAGCGICAGCAGWRGLHVACEARLALGGLLGAVLLESIRGA